MELCGKSQRKLRDSPPYHGFHDSPEMPSNQLDQSQREQTSSTMKGRCDETCESFPRLFVPVKMGAKLNTAKSVRCDTFY
jgi:hypothetical protein